jgi:Mg/Co/Ni transporter MgtE
MGIVAWVKNLVTKTKNDIEKLKLKAVKFITDNKTSIQGFIKLASLLYNKCEGKEKMEKVIKMVTASVAGTEYTDEQADALATQIESNIQKIYDEMHAKGLV